MERSPPRRPSEAGLVRGLGPLAATALVVGNTIGSGIYVVPGSLAEMAGPAAILAWPITALGYLCLAAVFADLGGAYPVAGGPQHYTQRAFGPLAGLQAGYLYWLSTVISSAALVTGFVGYLAIYFPELGDPLAAFLVALALLWSLTGVNIIGVRAGGAVQVATTVFKILPLLVLAAALLPRASTANLTPFAPHGYSGLLPAVALVAWLFGGMESLTVPAEEVKGSGPAVRRYTWLGFGLICAVYALVAGALALGVPSEEISGSGSPLAVAARGALGPAGQGLVTLGALVSIAGILNGTILVAGRLPFSTARAGLAPAFLARVHPRFGTPVAALVVSSALSSLLVLLYFNRTLLEAYNFIALLSSDSALFALAGASLSQIVLLRREPERFTPAQWRRGPVTAAAAFLMVLLMIAGAGRTIFLLTLLAMLPPLAYHLWRRREGAGEAGA